MLNRYKTGGFAAMAIGFLLIGFFASWLAAVGVYLLILGNNFEQGGDELEDIRRTRENDGP